MSETNIDTFLKSYWSYYLELENQFVATKKFVEFDISNHATYSIEYLKLFQAVCSEIDVVAKILAEEYDESFKKIKNTNIQKWGYYIQLAYPNIESISVLFNRDYTIYPWRNWKYETHTNKKGALSYKLIKGKKTPFWWTAYNNVKHERTSLTMNGKTNYALANQKNLIYSFAALFVLEMLYLDSHKGKENQPYTESQMFNLQL